MTAPVPPNSDHPSGPSGNDDESTRLARATHLLEAGRLDDSLTEMRQLAAEGCQPAMRTLGFMALAADRRTVADFWLSKAGDSGDADAMVAVGRIAITQGRAVRAREWLLRAANECGDGRAMRLMAELAVRAGDLGEAQAWMIRLARQGDATAPDAIFKIGLSRALDGDLVGAKQCWAESVRHGHTDSLRALRGVADLPTGDAVHCLEAEFRFAEQHDYATAIAERAVDIELTQLLRTHGHPEV